jgi:transposase-like protein
MDPQTRFCHNPDCPARGVVGRGNIQIHSRAERRYRCTTCRRTFAETRGTPFYRKRTAHDLITTVMTLLTHGCPPQAIVAAFGLDERTVATWQEQAGAHCQQVHAQVVRQGQVDLRHVQADELWAKMVGRRAWMAMAMAVPSRLRLGGVISPRRDLPLILTLIRMVRACARGTAILVWVDGLASYVTAVRRVFRDPVRTGRAGRPRLRAVPGLLLGQVIKHREKRRVVGMTRRVVLGTAAAIAAVLLATGTGTGINTAYIERLNATFRGAMAPLVRRGRALAHTEATLTAGMFLVGCAYNFCWEHEGLRRKTGEAGGRKWEDRTPAMAAGLTDHRWTMAELLSHRVPPPPWVAPKRRGRPPKPKEPRTGKLNDALRCDALPSCQLMTQCSRSARSSPPSARR